MTLTKAEISKRYRDSHREKLNGIQRIWRAKNRAHCNEWARDWRKKNADRLNPLRAIWAREYNRKKSEARKTKSGSVWKGRYWEEKLAKILKAEDMNKEVMGHPFDLLLDGQRIDVKCAELRIHDKRYATKSWKFSVSGDHKKTDFFFLVCLLNGRMVRAYLLPAKFAPLTGIALFETSDKYEKFRFPL